MKPLSSVARQVFRRSIPDPFQKLIEKYLYREEWKECEKLAHFLELSFNQLSTDDPSWSIDYQNFLHKRIIEHASANSLFWRDRIINSGARIDNHKSYRNIPLLTKQNIKEHFNDLICQKNRKSYIVHNTGGSTGTPLEFYISRQAGLVSGIHQEFALKVMGFVPDDRIISFDGTSIPCSLIKNKIYWIKKSRSELPWGRIHCSANFLNDETAFHYLECLRKERPQFLRGYPSALNILASNAIAMGFQPNWKIKSIYLTSEQIFPWQVDNIEKAFNTKVYRQYGQAETCVIGFCLDSSGKYLCSPYCGFTEILHPDGSHCRVGEKGEIVGTAFHNFIMPFIRYRTGDLAEYGGSIGGWTILNSIEGRTQDYLFDKSGTPIPVTALVFGQHFKAFRTMRQWQLYQKEFGKVEILIMPESNFSTQDQDELVKVFKDTVGLEAKITIVKNIEKSKSGKSQFVKIDNILST